MRRIKRIIDYIRYDIPRGIKNLIIWFPTVWCDRQWDNRFIYIILRQKLHFTEQTIRRYGHHENDIKDADRIKRCVDILDRLIEDAHYDEVFEEHCKKWGHPEFSWKEDKLYIKYPNVKTRLDDESEQIDFRKASNKEESSRQADIDELFEIMRKHIQEWWD